MLPAWATPYAGRRSHDQPRNENSRAPSPDVDAARRRSSSEATPRPTPAIHPQNLSSVVPHDPDLLSGSSSTSTGIAAMVDFSSNPSLSSSSRRLGFFADKLSNSQTLQASGSGQRSGLVPALLHPHSHSRSDATLTISSSLSSPSNMASLSSTPNLSKGHSSPSKLSSGRTYDSKLVSREMHRLGALAHSHLPAALAPTHSAAASSTSLALPGSNVTVGSITSAPAGENPWGALHVHLLPLFNDEPLRIPIEDLNILVKRHIQTIVSQSLSKALATLEHDASDLISAGMVTLNAKFVGVEDDKVLAKVVEVWGFFWDQVLPYVEGVLLPLQTDTLISSLYRTPKTHRNSSPTRQNASMSSSVQITTYHIDVRMVALKSFRDKVIVPLFPRLYARLSMPSKQDNVSQNTGYQQPRLQQMLLVLTSVGRQNPPSFSLTAPEPQPSVGEAAMADLLRALRSRPSHHQKRPMVRISKFMNGQLANLGHAPNLLWGGLPRDRRGRVAQKQKGSTSGGEDGDGEDGDVFGDGAETPRNGFGTLNIDVEREKEREFLESLRSPDVGLSGARASFGGWGLGGGTDDIAKTIEEDDEDDALDWDQAQAAVERMVGMKPELSPDSRRRA